jgi:hypothetical protein
MFKVKINPTTDEYHELLNRLNSAELNYNPDFSITYEYVLSYQKILPNQNDIPIVKQGIFMDSLSLIEVEGKNLEGRYVEKVSIPSYRETPSLASTYMSTTASQKTIFSKILIAIDGSDASTTHYNYVYLML